MFGAGVFVPGKIEDWALVVVDAFGAGPGDGFGVGFGAGVDCLAKAAANCA